MKTLTRRELFREMVSKDTIRKVASAWYGFTVPLKEGSQPPKKESLFEKVQRLEGFYRKNQMKPNERRDKKYGSNHS